MLTRHFLSVVKPLSQKRCKPHDWCPEPESNRYAGFTLATDFKSVVSTNFTTRAGIRRRVRKLNLHRLIGIYNESHQTNRLDVFCFAMRFFLAS